MCFSEFIGYTCGHSSAEVLRPCPMTTQFHTNPLCARHARRPILAPEMCPACQRILHGRAVLIVEWEHRWMHERGVCGCEVQFPNLFRPRVVGRGSLEGGEGGPHAAWAARGKNMNTHTIMTPGLPRTGGNNKAGARRVPALYQETFPIPTVTGGGRKPEVAVRIPSFYGAEWVDEHRQLHLKGSCRCAGDFSLYQTPANYPVVPSSPVHDVGEQAVPGAEPQLSQGHHGFQAGASSPHTTWQGKLTTAAFTGQFPSRGVGPSTTPQRSPGAIYEVDPARSTNRLYNFACDEGAKITTCADSQSVDFPDPKDILPLVGLPIGAGPEGSANFPHTGQFEDCVLRVKQKIAALGDEPLLLRSKSKSVSCLHELTMTRERCHEATHSLSVRSSSEASGSVSGLSSNHQL